VRAEAYAARVAPVVAAIRKAGALSLRQVTAEINARGVPTPRGAGTWSAQQVSVIERRLAANNPAISR
jgi:hypothetical protein